MAGREGRIFTVAQVKGGSCKTTMALAIGVRLKQKGRDVLVLDSDGTNTNIAAALRRRAEFSKNHPEYGLPLIAFAEKLKQKNLFESAMEAVGNGRDVVIDCNASNQDLVIAAMAMSNVIVVPLRQGHMDSDAYERMEPLIQIVQESKAEQGLPKAKIFSVLSDYRPTMKGTELAAHMEGIKYAKFLGVVPHSERLGELFYSGIAFWERSKRASALQFQTMVDAIIK